MNPEIRQKIEQIKNGKVPDGYHYSRAGLSPNDWGKGSLYDVLYNEQRAIPKPNEGYWRIGIRSHAKGTFHEYVENPEAVDMDELYVVRENDLILNITFAWEHAVALADKDDDGLLVSHRFPTYVFREGQNPIFYKSVAVQKRFKEMLGLISPGGAGRNRVMSKKDFLRLPCNIPPFVEQQKIAEILIQCDKVIELKQKRIEEERKLKKALMQKLFSIGHRETKEFEELFKRIPAKKHQINSSDYNVEGEYPVVDQGKKLICGYSNDSEKVLKGTEQPVIIFGDHTREIKYVDFDFIIGADGVQIMRSNTDVDLKYLYYNLCNLRIENLGYSRHIKLLTERVFEIHTSETTRNDIVNLLASRDEVLNKLITELEQWENMKKSLMQLLLTGIVRADV